MYLRVSRIVVEEGNNEWEKDGEYRSKESYSRDAAIIMTHVGTALFNFNLTTSATTLANLITRRM